jgi:hypothetical protein
MSLDTLTPTQRLRFAALGIPAGSDWLRALIEPFLATVHSVPESQTRSAAEDLDWLAALSLVTINTPSTLTTHVAPDAGVEPSSDAGVPPPAARVRLHPLLRDLAREEWHRLTVQDSAIQEKGVLALIEAGVGFIRYYQRQFPVLAREEELLVGAIHDAAKLPETYQTCLSAIASLGEYLHLGGHWSLGQSLYEQALPILREIGDRENQGVILGNLGQLAQHLGQNEHPPRSHA